MSAPRRGDVYWVDLDLTVGSESNKRRLAVVVSLNVLNERRNTVIVVPLSSQGTHRPPLVVAVSSAGEPGTARIDQVRTVDKSRLRERIGTLSSADRRAIEDSLRAVLGL